MQIHSAKGDFCHSCNVSMEMWNATWSQSNIILLWPVKWINAWPLHCQVPLLQLWLTSIHCSHCWRSLKGHIFMCLTPETALKAMKEKTWHCTYINNPHNHKYHQITQNNQSTVISHANNIQCSFTPFVLCVLFWGCDWDRHIVESSV